MIKKVVMVFLAALLCVVFTSCDSGPSRYEQAGSMGEDIMECIKNGDVEKLSGYFSEYIQKTHNLDEEGKALLELFDSEIVSYDVTYVNDGPTKYDFTEVYRMMLVKIQNVKTKNNGCYEVYIYYIPEYGEDETKIGVCEIDIWNEDLYNLDNPDDPQNDQYKQSMGHYIDCTAYELE